MAADKFSATWVSHTSICDFQECPRAYFLKHVYRDPKTGHKVKLTNPSLSLGQTVHDVLEAISVLPTDRRLLESPLARFEEVWKNVSGRRGGFITEETEYQYKSRGADMIRRVVENPGPIGKLAVKIKMDLPYYWISEDENIILCGKIDWLEYLQEKDAVHIIDFKTGKRDEDGNSLQLPIYYLIVRNCQHRPVEKVSYWYLERGEIIEHTLPNEEEATEKVIKIARSIKVAKKLDKLTCSNPNGCYACRPMEAIVNGEAEFVGTDNYNQDLYLLERELSDGVPESEVL